MNKILLLNGEAKTLQVDSIECEGANGYRVRFKNNSKSYYYGCDKVAWLYNPEWFDPTHCKVVVDGALQNSVKEIWKFVCGTKCYWRIVYGNGYMREGDDDKMIVSTSCLGEEKSRDTFAYLKNVAIINPLGKEKNGNGILADLYEQVEYVDSETVAACYLNPNKYNPRSMKHADLIYPFGCNASQKKAVTTAFEHQISVVQGPPGTGKTQTILNIIANIVCQGKTVMVVSNNNSAITNVQEKLDKYGLSFVIAPLGSKENKEVFIANQPLVPAECSLWGLSISESLKKKQKLHATLALLDKVFALQNERAELLQEQQAVALEWKHFCMDNGVDERLELTNRINSKRVISLWLEYQAQAYGEKPISANWFVKWLEKLKWWKMKWFSKHRLYLKSEFDRNNLTPLVKEFQTLYYLNRLEEIRQRINSINKDLAQHDAMGLTKTLTTLSLSLFKAFLYSYYSKHKRVDFAGLKDMRRRGNELIQQYPVVLSTTFSARSCVFTGKPYDYIIMDEASQVSIDTGALALTCARNAVIVGDTMQLPNVVTDEDRLKLDAIMRQYNITDGYDCAKNSFLQSVLGVIKNVPETLLREHYRCHPRIINFCNQKFYGGTCSL